MTDALATQVGGSHYKDDKIQHAEFCQANHLPYIIGNTLKYIMRHRKKNGRQDLEKAKHYLQILLELDRKYEARPAAPFRIQTVQLIQANGIEPAEAAIIYSCLRYHQWDDTHALFTAIQFLDILMDTVYGKQA